MTDILDISRDNETGEITQFLVMDGVEPETIVASPENLLLYDPEDNLPFEGGLSSFLDGDSALQLGESIIVAQSGNDYSYILSVDGNVVETTPTQAEDFLQGVYDAVAEEDNSKLRALHADIISNQVRRSLMNTLHKTFGESHRIEVVENGWLVDGFYLVDWNAKMYAANDDPKENDYVRDSTGVRKDTTYEFVRLRHNIGQAETIELTVGGETYTLTEREMLFLTKIKWLLNRRHYHPDRPFWQFADRWADVDAENGEPVQDGGPNLDVYNI